jgi:hypothetical protein
MKPAAAINPKPASLNPNLSCRSDNAEKIIEFDTVTANAHINNGPMPIVNLASPRGAIV